MAETRHAKRHTPSNSHPADQDVSFWSSVDPRRDKARIAALNSTPLAPDRYDSILASGAFTQWRREWKTTKKQLLWIKGEPGSGKTTQVCGIIDNLHRNDPGVVLSYFFCEGSDARRNTADVILRGLIYLLLQQLPILTKYTTGKKRRQEKTKDTWTTLSGVFSSILQDAVTKRRHVCFVVDGLDECETGVAELLELIARTSSPSSSHVKWIVSSRDSAPAIADDNKMVALCLASSPDASVTAHMIQHTALQCKYDAETEAAIRDALTDSSPLLRTALLCRSLTGLSACDGIAYVRACPAGVDGLYANILQRLDESGQGEVCRRLLAVSVVVRRPLALPELAIFLESSPENADGLNETLQHCSAFLAVHDGTVYLAHASVKAFLTTLNSSDNFFAACVNEANLKIFSKSLEAMSRTLRRDMYDLRRPGITTDNIQTPDTNPLAAVRYSCVYWVDHLLDAYSRCDDIGNLVDAFLRDKYLYWLEALGLLGQISEGVRAMERVVDFANRLGPTLGLSELALDAHKFIVAHAPTIMHAPLQTYASALLFTPAPSLIKELFGAEAPSWVTLSQPEMADDDNHHGGPVWTVAFSPTDGNSNSKFEFAASASDDSTLKIWDVKSHKCTQTLRGHTDLIWSLTFSHDGSALCSASDDGTVRIWDVNVATGTVTAKRVLDGHGDAAFSRQLTLRGHQGWVWSVAYAHAGELVASGSNNNEVKIWDVVTGTCLQTLLGHIGEVRAITFRGNNLVASGSFDGTVRLWDLKAKKCILTIRDGDYIFSVVFSPDGRHIAGASMQRLRVWEVATGRLLLTLGPDIEPTQLVYSNDGKRLASVSRDGIARLWDMESGRCERAFDRELSELWSVAMSRDGRLLAAGSESGTVMVWDAVHGACLLRLNHSDRSVGGLEFARGDGQIISACLGGSVCVWSTATGMNLQKFQGHRDTLVSISISHDGYHLATASEDNTVKIWDIAYGRAAWAAVFSHNNELLASCCDGGTVRLWELATGEFEVLLKGSGSPVYAVAFAHSRRDVAVASDDGCVLVVPLDNLREVCRLRGHCSAVWAVAYASDDRRLASAASDRTVRIWDVSTSTCVQVLDVGVSLASIAFGEGNQYLRTEIGRIKVDDTATAVTDASEPEAAGPQEWQHDYALSADKCWITDRGENVLWLPREYRPLSVAVDDINKRICIGCRSGRLLFFSFATDD